MENNSRWLKAQEYELNWWKKRHTIIDLSYLNRFAEELIKDINQYKIIDIKSSILEIGSGPAGILTHLPGKVRFAIDPLENFYSSIPEYVQYRSKNVLYFDGMGENLPFTNSTFDLVIIDNVLDHCQNPALVVDEIKRVLKGDGIIYFKQNIYHSFGKMIRNILEKFEFDKGHPHNFTFNDVMTIFAKNDIELDILHRRGHLKQLVTELKMKNLKALIRIITFMTRDKITLIGRLK